MISLADFLSKKRKYIAAIYNDETQENLRKWCKENGFDLTKKYKGEDQPEEDFRFHTTIIYSESIHKMDNGTVELDTFQVRPFEFALLGEDKDIPVIKVDGHSLYKIRSYYIDQYEMWDKWPTYLPHISVSYVRNPDYDLKLKLPKFKLWADKITIEDVESDI